MKRPQEALRGAEGDRQLLPGARADDKADAPTTILRALPRRARRLQGRNGAAEEDQGQVQKQEGQSLLRSGGARRVGLRRSKVVFDNGEYSALGIIISAFCLALCLKEARNTTVYS